MNIAKSNLKSHFFANRKARKLHAFKGRIVGFTLIELMVTLIIAVVLMSMVAPQFVEVINTNRVTTEINSLSSDFQLARSEAIKRGNSVSICASSNGTSCLTSTSVWNSGWIVFLDPIGNKAVDAGDTILKVEKGWTNGDTLSSSGTVSAVTFSGDGFTSGVASTVIFKMQPGTGNVGTMRCLQMTSVGRSSILKYDGSTCS